VGDSAELAENPKGSDYQLVYTVEAEPQIEES
jgi:hypothetical protein